jgi:hypothetical protein
VSAVPQLRPLGIGEILDVAIKITTRHWWTLARVVLVVVVPVQVLSALIDLSASEGLVTGDGVLEDDEVGPFVAAVASSVVLGLLAQTVATGACFKTVADAYLGRVPSWRRSLAETFRRLHSIVWVSILVYVLGFLGLLALIIPGIWLFISWTVAVPALLTEGVKGRRALGRSFRLVRGFWWRTFAIVLVSLILAGIVEAAITGALTGLVFTSDSDFVAVVATGLASLLAGALTTPFVAAVTIVLYVDLRVRKEGFDLALLAARFGEPVGEPAAGESLIPAPPPPRAPWQPRTAGGGGSTPPYWPPPPGWRPEGDET